MFDGDLDGDVMGWFGGAKGRSVTNHFDGSFIEGRGVQCTKLRLCPLQRGTGKGPRLGARIDADDPAMDLALPLGQIDSADSLEYIRGAFATP